MHIVTQVFNIFFWLLVTSMLAVSFSLGVFWYYIQSPPITIYNSYATTPVAIPGGKVAITIDLQQTYDCLFDARHVLVDSENNIRELQPSYSIIPSDKSVKSVSFVFDLPQDLPPGVSSIRTQFVAECNPLKKHIMNVDYIEFTVSD